MSSQSRKWKFRIRHMLEAIERIQQYASGLSRDQLSADTRTLDAIVWNLTVLGEAANHVPHVITLAYPQIPWPQIRGTRNRIVHGYDQIDFSIVWEVVQSELPPLVPVLQQIMTNEVD